MLRRQKHVPSQSTTPFACTLLTKINKFAGFFAASCACTLAMLDSNQKKPDFRTKHFRPAIQNFWARKWLRLKVCTGDFLVLCAGKLPFPLYSRFRGGGSGFFWRGGNCQFCVYGRGNFSETRILNLDNWGQETHDSQRRDKILGIFLRPEIGKLSSENPLEKIKKNPV